MNNKDILNPTQMVFIAIPRLPFLNSGDSNHHLHSIESGECAALASETLSTDIQPHNLLNTLETSTVEEPVEGLNDQAVGTGAIGTQGVTIVEDQRSVIDIGNPVTTITVQQDHPAQASIVSKRADVVLEGSEFWIEPPMGLTIELAD